MNFWLVEVVAEGLGNKTGDMLCLNEQGQTWLWQDCKYIHLHKLNHIFVTLLNSILLQTMNVIAYLNI